MSTDKLAIKSTTHQIDDMRWQINDNLRKQKAIRRELKTNQLGHLEHTWTEMANSHTKKGNRHYDWGWIGPMVQIAGSLFHHNSGSARACSSIGSAISQAVGVPDRFAESDQTRLQGLLESLREKAGEENRREDEIRKLISEIFQTLDAAIERAIRSKSSIFSP